MKKTGIIDKIRDIIIIFLFWIIGFISFISLLGFTIMCKLIFENKILYYFSIIISIIGFIVYNIIFLSILKESSYSDS